MNTLRIIARNITIGVFVASTFYVSGQKMTTLFQEVCEIPEGKGVVYIYSVKKKSPFSYRIYADKNPIRPALYSGGYFIYYSDPGYVTLSSLKDGHKDSLLVGVRAGETCFVEGSLRTGSFSGTGTPVLELPDPAKARKRIADCKLIADE